MNDLQITIENLIKGRDYLLGLPKEELDVIKRDFDMRYYGCYSHLSSDQLHLCKSIGCILGNLARAFDLSDSRYYNDDCFEYDLFNEIIFPFLNVENNGWEFLFSHDWADWQPTFDQAIERIDYFIAKKGDIGEWEFQRESFLI